MAVVLEIIRVVASEHILITHAGEKSYKCKLCQKSFAQGNSLKMHMKFHTGEKPYKCHFCQKLFTTRSVIRRHLRIHTGEKKYKCKLCQTSVTTGELKMHMITHTGEKPHKCKLCQKSFTTGDALKKHMRIHTGKKPYKYQLCQKSFRPTDGGDLKTHRRTHTSEKPFTCEICKRGFIRLGSLKKHMGTHTNESLQTCDTLVRKGSSSTVQKGIHHQGVEMMKSKSIGDLSLQFIALDSRSGDLIDKTNDQLPWNISSDCNEAKSPLLKSNKVKSPEDTKPYLERRFGCGICSEMFEVEKEFLEHCSSHRFFPPDDLFLDLC